MTDGNYENKFGNKTIALNLEALGSKVPPHSNDSEISVLGSLMLDSMAFLTATEYLTPESFYNIANREIYSAMLEMNRKNLQIDMVSLAEYLNSKNLLDKTGGTFYIAEIEAKTPSAANIETHCRIVQEKFIKREIISKCGNMLARAYDNSSDALELVDEYQKAGIKFTESLIRNNARKVSELAPEFYDEVQFAQDNAVNAVVTPALGINYIIRGGFQGPKLYGFAARPGEGKSAKLIACMKSAAKSHKVLFYSVEMDAMEIMERLTANITGIDSYKLMGNGSKLSNPELIEVGEHLSKFTDYDIWIDDTPMWHIDRLKLDIKKNVQKYGVDVVMIDYLQLIGGEGTTRRTREQEITYVANTLKASAKNTKIPHVVAIQFNRDADGKKPKLRDLRESGGIEQALDVCIALYDNQKHDPNDTVVEIQEIVLKQRGGRKGVETIRYDKSLCRFTSLDKAHEQEPTDPPRNVQEDIKWHNEPKERGILDDEDEKPFE